MSIAIDPPAPIKAEAPVKEAPAKAAAKEAVTAAPDAEIKLETPKKPRAPRKPKAEGKPENGGSDGGPAEAAE